MGKSRPMSPPPSHAARHKSPPRHTRPLSPPPPPKRDHRDRDYRDSRDSRRDHSRDRDRRDSSRDRDHSRHSRNQEERPPTRHTPKNDSTSDPFWDSKWEAKELQKEADAKERRGKHYLDNTRRLHKENEKASKRVSDKKKREEEKRLEESDGEECDELRRLKEMQKVANLDVEESEKYVAEPADPSQFEWNPKTRMYQRKIVDSDSGDDEKEMKKEAGEEEGEVTDEKQDFDSDLKKRMDEQVDEGRRSKFKPISDSSERKALTQDEIEEIRKKREKFKE